MGAILAMIVTNVDTFNNLLDRGFCALGDRVMVLCEIDCIVFSMDRFYVCPVAW